MLTYIYIYILILLYFLLILLPLASRGVSNIGPKQGERLAVMLFFRIVFFTPYIHFFLGSLRVLYPNVFNLNPPAADCSGFMRIKCSNHLNPLILYIIRVNLTSFLFFFFKAKRTRFSCVLL